MQRRTLLWSVTSALAGFLFGFDTVVISGAEQTIQSLWGLSPRDARRRDGSGALRHGRRLARRRLADRPLRAQGDAPLDRPPLPGLGARLRVRRPVSARSSPRDSSAASGSASRPSRRRSTSPRSRRRRTAAGSPACSSSTSCSASSWPSRRTRMLAGIGESAWRWMLGVAAIPSVDLHAPLLRHPREPAVAARPQGRPRGRAARPGDDRARRASRHGSRRRPTRSSPRRR